MPDAKYCIVYRKRGEYESHWELTELTGNDFDKADAFRRAFIAPQWGGDTGKHTTHVEELEKVMEEL